MTWNKGFTGVRKVGAVDINGRYVIRGLCQQRVWEGKTGNLVLCNRLASTVAFAGCDRLHLNEVWLCTLHSDAPKYGYVDCLSPDCRVLLRDRLILHGMLLPVQRYDMRGSR